MKGSLTFLTGIAIATMVGCREEADDSPSITVAVASNFLATAREIGAEFSAQSGVEIVFVSGSTGKLAAQIQQGAPFDLFLSADRATPQFLVERGLIKGPAPLTYAIGRLALYSHHPELKNVSGEFPALDRFEHLAIANPELAPYGRAARETLTSLSLWDILQPRIVRGENISQTWHFVSSGNADLGLVALSQVHGDEGQNYRLIPARHHTPIEQAAILIHDSATARRFLNYLTSPNARRIIESHGYDLPPLTNVE